MLNNHGQAINTPSPSNLRRGARKVYFNQEQVENARRIRTNAEMADVTRMGLEIETRYFGDLPEWERTDKRKEGPAVVAMSNNKNSSSLGDKYSPEWWDYVKNELAA